MAKPSQPLLSLDKKGSEEKKEERKSLRNSTINIWGLALWDGVCPVNCGCWMVFHLCLLSTTKVLSSHLGQLTWSPDTARVLRGKLELHRLRSTVTEQAAYRWQIAEAKVSLKQTCCGGLKNNPHRFTYWNPWSQDGETVWEGLEGIALLEEVGFEVSQVHAFLCPPPPPPDCGSATTPAPCLPVCWHASHHND